MTFEVVFFEVRVKMSHWPIFIKHNYFQEILENYELSEEISSFREDFGPFSEYVEIKLSLKNPYIFFLALNNH